MIRAIFAVSLGLSSTSIAAVSISWGTFGPDITQSNTAGAPANWVAQVMFTRDTNIATPNPLDPLGGHGDDEVLHQQLLNAFAADGIIVHIDTGDAFSGDGKHSVADSYAGGYVYTRVFDINFSDVGSATPTQYGVSALSSALQVETFDPTTVTNHNPVVAVNLAVPEPSISLLGACGALLLFRRGVREKS